MMGSMKSNEGNWDFMMIGRDGSRSGFRLSLKLARRFVMFFAFAMMLLSFSFLGWMLSRWESVKLAQDLRLEKMKAEGLEASLEEMKSRYSGTSLQGVDASALEAYTLFPSLDVGEITSSLVELKEDQIAFDASTEEISLKFEIERRPPRDSTARFFWAGLLHGPQGILSIPPVLASRNGDPVLFHRGEALDDVKIRRSVSARYQVKDFVRRSGAEPVYFTLLVYDNKGSLLTRKRYDVKGSRAQDQGGGL